MSKIVLKHFINTLIMISWLVDKSCGFHGSFGNISLVTYFNTIILLLATGYVSNMMH